MSEENRRRGFVYWLLNTEWLPVAIPMAIVEGVAILVWAALNGLFGLVKWRLAGAGGG